jgi:hypothetical protein
MVIYVGTAGCNIEGVTQVSTFIGGLLAELALPGSPHSVKAPVLARRQLAELVIRLLGKFEDVMGDGQAVIVVEHSEKVIRVDTSTRCVRYEEGAIRSFGRGKCVDIKVALKLVVWPRGYDKRVGWLVLDGHSRSCGDCPP